MRPIYGPIFWRMTMISRESLNPGLHLENWMNYGGFPTGITKLALSKDPESRSSGNLPERWEEGMLVFVKKGGRKSAEKTLAAIMVRCRDHVEEAIFSPASQVLWNKNQFRAEMDDDGRTPREREEWCDMLVVDGADMLSDADLSALDRVLCLRAMPPARITILLCSETKPEHILQTAQMYGDRMVEA